MIAKEPTDRITLTEVMDGLKPKPIPPAVVVFPPAPRYLTGSEITPIWGLELGMNFG
jgi:hypothetical protein